MSTITLPNIRVSSDLEIRLKLKDGGVAIDWSTLTNIKASIYSDRQRSLAGRCDIAIDEEDSTILVCRYSANKPQYPGVNRVIVCCTYDGETKTYDKPAFTFVRWTDDQAGQSITIDDPDIDVEISVEDVSSSILQEAVEAAFTAAERADEAAAAAEHMVDIHTGPAGKSAYEVAVEEGYTGTEEEWLASLEGPVGATPDISIGTVTTVEPGTPAAATMTGTPEAPVLNLTIPKGVAGDTPNFTVGEVTTGQPGTPVVVTITGTAAAPVLNVQIPQGIQGNTGSSVDYPFELVNNTTTDDATKAATAAVAKGLKDDITQLEAEVAKFDTKEITLTDDDLRNYSILSTGDYGTSTSYKHKIVPVNVGDKCVIYAAGSAGCRYAFFNATTDPSSGGALPLVDGTSVVDITSGSYANVTIPSGCVALAFQWGQSPSWNFKPNLYLKIPIEKIQEDVEKSLVPKTDKMYPVVIDETTLNLGSYTERSYSIQDNGNYNTNSGYKHITIPCAPGYMFRITANQTLEARYAWLTSQENPVSGGAALLVPGTSLTHLEAGGTVEITAPSGSKYLYIYLGSSGNVYTPSSVVLIETIEKDILALESTASIFVNDLKFEIVDLGDATFRDYAIQGSGMYGTSTNYKHFIFPISEQVKFIKIKANTSNQSRIAFLYTNAAPVSGDAIPMVAGTSVVIIDAGASKILQIPTGTTNIIVYSGMSQAYKPDYVGIYHGLVQRAIPVKMELGTLTSEGKDLNTVSDSTQYGYINTRLRSSLYVNISDKDTIVSVSGLLTGETLRYSCFDSGLNYLGGSESILPGTEWVRVIIYLGTTVVTHDVTFTVYKKDEVRFMKETGPIFSGGSSRILFEVAVPTLPDDTDDVDFSAQSVRTADTGFLILPDGYSRDGAPVPLVLWCHGTGGFVFNSPYAAYGNNMLYTIAQNGYAVADCSGITALYGSSSSPQYVSDLEDSKNNPLLIECYKKLVEHLGIKYNIDTKSVYILSKSAGGLIASQLAYNLGSRIRAIAHFAPALCMVGQSWRVTGNVPEKFWLERFGIDTTGYASLTETQKEQLWLDNLDKVFGYDPLFEGTEIDFRAACERMFTHPHTSAKQLGEDYAADDVLMAMFDAPKNVPVPTKIWHAPDDTVVPILWSRKFVEMAKKGGCVCALRVMPTGTGGHHCMDSSDDAPTTSYLNKDGQTTTIRTAVAEAIEWFKRW